jgi:hypothetical protein
MRPRMAPRSRAQFIERDVSRTSSAIATGKWQRIRGRAAPEIREGEAR